MAAPQEHGVVANLNRGVMRSVVVRKNELQISEVVNLAGAEPDRAAGQDG